MIKVKQTRNYQAVNALASAIDSINRHVQFSTWEEFRDSLLIQDAVYFQLSILSETIHDVDKGILDKYDYPWYQLKTFRKLMFNDKFHIRKRAVWHLVKDGIPELEKIISLMLANEFPHESKN